MSFYEDSGYRDEINDKKTIGYAIIVANIFANNPKLYRSGTEAEVKILKELFSKLGFEPIIFGEVTKHDFLSRMIQIGNNPITKKHDIIVLVICSHGFTDRILFPTQNMIKG